MTRIKTIAEFKALLRRGKREFAIALGCPLISRKHIEIGHAGRYEVFHGIDGRIESLSFKELLHDTNIGKALKNGSFYLETEAPLSVQTKT